MTSYTNFNRALTMVPDRIEGRPKAHLTEFFLRQKIIARWKPVSPVLLVIGTLTYVSTFSMWNTYTFRINFLNWNKNDRTLNFVFLFIIYSMQNNTCPTIRRKTRRYEKYRKQNSRWLSGMRVKLKFPKTFGSLQWEYHPLGPTRRIDFILFAHLRFLPECWTCVICMQWSERPIYAPKRES